MAVVFMQALSVSQLSYYTLKITALKARKVMSCHITPIIRPHTLRHV